MLTHQILELLNDKTILTCNELGRELNCNPSKIRKELDYIELILPINSAVIVKKRGRGNGYLLNINNEDLYKHFLMDLEKKEVIEKQSMNHPKSRIEVLCHKLLNCEVPLKSEDLADEFLISRRQLNNDLHVVRAFLKDYTLELKNIPHHGMKIVGNEFNKRLCLANLYMKNFSFKKKNDHQLFLESAENNHILRKIREIIQEEFDKLNILFSDVALQNLIVHCFIMINRSSIDQVSENDVLIGVSEIEKNVTNQIALRLSKAFSITINHYDFNYMLIHIAGKRAYLNEEVSLISSETKNLVFKSIEKVDEIYKTNFKEDDNLILRMQLHFAPMLIRLRNGIHSKNPITNDVKIKYSMSYEIAQLVGEMVENYCGVKLVDDELAYIAMHIELSLYQTKLKKYKVLLICHTGLCSSEILKQQLLSKFDHYITELDTCSLNQVAHYNLDDYTFVFSTVPVSMYTKTPIYMINNFLDDQNLNFINKIFERGDFSTELTQKFFPEDLFMGVIASENKDEVISIMCDYLKQRKVVPENFLELVMKREMYYPTDYGNLVAIPHPINMNEDGKTFSCVAILQKTIKWGENSVRVVFLNNIAKGAKDVQFYYYLLSKFITNNKNIESLINNPIYDNMIRLIHEES